MERVVLASTNAGDTVLDPFCGSGSTGVASLQNGRNFIGIEQEKEYFELSKARLDDAQKEYCLMEKLEEKDALSAIV